MTVWPSGLRTIPRVTDEFGPRINPVTGIPGFHYGIDLVGWAINKSPCDGVVIFAAYNGGAGNQVTVRADNGDTFVMMHNARFLVSRGQRVSEGEGVGVQGTTGNSTGVHCHFETRPGGGAAVNPRGYMAAAIGSSPAGGSSTPITKDWFDMATLDELRAAVRAEVSSLMDDEARALDATRREARGWRLFHDLSAPDYSDVEYVAINYNLPPGDPRQVIRLSAAEANSLRANYLMLADTTANAQKLSAEGIATAIRLANGTDQVYAAPAAPATPAA